MRKVQCDKCNHTFPRAKVVTMRDSTSVKFYCVVCASNIATQIESKLAELKKDMGIP